MIDLPAMFAEHEDDEYLEFSRVPASERLSNRPDLNAFMLLDRLCPGDDDIVQAAEHDEFWLDVDCAALAEVATEADIITLLRCGVRYDDDIECLALFT